jgi:hypothetical protein
MPIAASPSQRPGSASPPVSHRWHGRHRSETASRSRRSAVLGTGALALLGTLTACSLPNLSMSSSVSDTKASTSTTRTPAASSAVQPTTATASGTPSVRATAPRAAGALDTGSVTHKAQVGPFSAVLVYYTADNAKLYRDSSTKTIRVAVHLEGAPRKQTILVNNFVATADDGVARTIVEQNSHSFAITPPQSYNSVVTIPATAHTSTSVTLIVELDLSVQISPKSKLYAAQTSLDSLTIPLLPGSQS